LNFDARVQQASIYDRRDENRKAIDTLLAVLQKKNDRKEVHAFLSALYRKIKEYPKAIQSMEQVITLDPKSDQAHFQLGALYDENKNKEKTIASMRKAIELNPKNAAALNYLGYTWAEMGERLDEAEDLIARALKATIGDKERVLAELQDLNRTLEERIQERTAELQERRLALERSLAEVHAMGEVGRAVGSSLDLGEVLDTISAHAAQLSGSDACGIFELDPQRGQFLVVSSYELGPDFLAALQGAPEAADAAAGRGPVRSAMERGEAVQIPDIAVAGNIALGSLFLGAGFRALLAMPEARSPPPTASRPRPCPRCASRASSTRSPRGPRTSRTRWSTARAAGAEGHGSARPSRRPDRHRGHRSRRCLLLRRAQQTHEGRAHRARGRDVRPGREHAERADHDVEPQAAVVSLTGTSSRG
jgi:Tfp pilus assembly protein PilF